MEALGLRSRDGCRPMSGVPDHQGQPFDESSVDSETGGRLFGPPTDPSRRWVSTNISAILQ